MPGDVGRRVSPSSELGGAHAQCARDLAGAAENQLRLSSNGELAPFRPEDKSPLHLKEMPIYLFGGPKSSRVSRVE